MAFGFFKKKKTADAVYYNGQIYTGDPDFPWAQAVAVSGGRVLAVGESDAMEEISGEETQLIDLKGQYMFPGFIEAHCTDILKAFEGLYLEIDPVWDLDTVLDAVRDYAQQTDREIIFAYGYNEAILADYDKTEEVLPLLDEVESDRPVVLLGVSGVHCWTNSLAAQIVEQTAEDSAVQYITTDYILDVLQPLSFEEIETGVVETMDRLSDRGITAFFPLNTPDYFNMLYQNCLIALIGEDISIKQRLYASLHINRPLSTDLILHKLAMRRTGCIELDGIITYDFLEIELSENPNFPEFSQDKLNEICLAAAERNCGIRLDAPNPESTEKGWRAFSYLRDKGRKTNTLVLATDRELPAESGNDFLTTWPADFLDASVYSHATDVEQAIDLLTANAAYLIGADKDLGSIEQGKKADFTVFEENPLEKSLSYFSGMHASMTILDGEVVYDLEEACKDEMYDLFTSMRL